MNKDDTYYIQSILEFCRKIIAVLQKYDRSIYDTDEVVQTAIIHWIQVIGEATSHLSREFQEKHNNFEWHKIVAMRNRIVHDYLGIDDEIIWETATKRVPELLKFIENLTSQ
ncbi:MAG TPA: DUF86 domain-containing protein [Aggregatilineales bacterium]|nr:DUF86 domain-containing protein [Aggregatilineales bacterium]